MIGLHSLSVMLLKDHDSLVPPCPSLIRQRSQGCLPHLFSVPRIHVYNTNWIFHILRGQTSNLPCATTKSCFQDGFAGFDCRKKMLNHNFSSRGKGLRYGYINDGNTIPGEEDCM